MADRAAAERACKDPNPIIDGRKANVNLAYLGAKPRIMQPGMVIFCTFLKLDTQVTNDCVMFSSGYYYVV